MATLNKSVNASKEGHQTIRWKEGLSIKPPPQITGHTWVCMAASKTKSLEFIDHVAADRKDRTIFLNYSSMLTASVK